MPLFRIQQLFAAVNVPFKTFPAPFCKKFIAVSISLSVLNCKLAIQSWICVLLLNISSAHFCTFGKKCLCRFCKFSHRSAYLRHNNKYHTRNHSDYKQKSHNHTERSCIFLLFSVFCFLNSNFFNRSHRYIKYKSYYSAQKQTEKLFPQNSHSVSDLFVVLHYNQRYKREQYYSAISFYIFFG